MSDGRVYVKLARGEWETVMFIGTAAEADTEKNRLNDLYQTDEYYTESYDPDKATGWNLKDKYGKPFDKSRPVR